jgi:hypothetical protein
MKPYASVRQPSGRVLASLAACALGFIALFVALTHLFVRQPPVSPIRTGHAAWACTASDRIKRPRPALPSPPVPSAAAPRVSAERGLGSGETDAFAAAALIGNPALREETLVRLCFQRAESDPRAALELALAHGLEAVTGEVVGNLAQQWAATDLSAALDWVKAQPQNPIREELVARVGYVWSLHDPASAAAFVTGETPAGDTQVEAAMSVLHQWGRRDPEAARVWGDCFPTAELRQRALHEAGQLTSDGH